MKPGFRVIAVTGGGPDLLARVHTLLDAGLEVLVREPALPEGLPLDRVILHARMPGALAVARQLHVGAGEDLAALRTRFAVPFGVSCHDPEEAATARGAGAAYTFLSPIFADRHGRPARGTAGLAGNVALGGITLDTCEMCHAAGAVGVAVLGALWSAPDLAGAARAFRDATRGW